MKRHNMADAFTNRPFGGGRSRFAQGGAPVVETRPAATGTMLPGNSTLIQGHNTARQ